MSIKFKIQEKVRVTAGKYKNHTGYILATGLRGENDKCKRHVSLVEIPNLGDFWFQDRSLIGV